MVRPIFGGIGGGAIGLYATDENSDAPLTAGLMAGIALGIFNKRLENYKAVFESENNDSLESKIKEILNGNDKSKLNRNSLGYEIFGKFLDKFKSLNPHKLVVI